MALAVAVSPAASPNMLSPPSLPKELQTLRPLTNYYAWIFEELQPFLGARLVEIGGGIGTFAAVLLRTHVLGRSDTSLDVFEPDAELFGRLDIFLHEQFHPLIQAGRLRVIQDEFRPAPRRYDSTILINALEHIEDDGRLLASIHESLAPQGTVIVYVPALSWLFSPLDRDVGHFRRYDMHQLRHLFETHGFAVVKAIYMDMAGIIPWYVLNVVCRSRTISPTLARFYDRWGIPAIRALEQRTGAPLGKNILMIGRKPGDRLK